MLLIRAFTFTPPFSFISPPCRLFADITGLMPFSFHAAYADDDMPR